MKSFLKINKSKVITTIVIGVLNIGFGIYSSLVMLCTYNCPVPNLAQSFLSFTLYPFTVVLLLVEFFEDMAFLPETLMVILALLLGLIILILFWYLLTCIIIKIISYFKKETLA